MCYLTKTSIAKYESTQVYAMTTMTSSFPVYLEQLEVLPRYSPMMKSRSCLTTTKAKTPQKTCVISSSPCVTQDYDAHVQITTCLAEMRHQLVMFDKIILDDLPNQVGI